MKNGGIFASENEQKSIQMTLHAHKMKSIEAPARLFDIMIRRGRDNNRRPCFRYRGEEMMADTYRRQVDNLSHALLLRGMKRGEAVALVSENRPEWNVIDMAVMQAGGVLLPLCKGLSAEEYTECLCKAGVRLMFLEDEELYGRFRLILPQIDTLEFLLSIEPVPTAVPLERLLVEGRVNANPAELERRRSLITTDDICTLVYSGGGTYRRITHKSLIEDVMEQSATETYRRQAAAGNNALCTLYGRTKNYVCQLVGRTVNYPSPEIELERRAVA